MTFRRLAKPLVPPLLWSAGKNLKRRLLDSVDDFAYASDGWNTLLPPGGGNEAYWSAAVEREQEWAGALIARLRAGDPALAPEDETVKYIFFGYALALASRCRATLSVLDYGGSLGEYYWLGESLVAGVELEFHCRELPAIAGTGRLVTPAAIWHTDDSCLDASYDVVMFSASLEYLPQWREILQRAAHATRMYLVLSDIPAVRRHPTFVIKQRSAGVTHLQYVFNRSEVADLVRRAGLKLVRELTMGSHPMVRTAPEQPMSAGWLFTR